MTLSGRHSTVLICLGLFAFPAAGQEATPSPTATPFPVQDTPPGLPPGFDDAIATPTPASTPVPLDSIAMPPDHDDFLSEPPPDDSDWDPTKPFPGNYYSVPVTLDVGWRPCLDCSGNVFDRPGSVTLWAGYAFQPWAAIQSPYMALGVEATVASVEGGGGTWRGRKQLVPTLRTGWNFSAASVYTVAGVIVPGEERSKTGYHVGIGASSFAFLALAACSAEAIPSVIEIGADFVDDEELGRKKGEWTLKLGWGF